MHRSVASTDNAIGRMNILSTGHARGRSDPRDTTGPRSMVPPTPTPSARLVRAAAAERGDIARHRERLLGARDRLHAELAGIETALRDLDERDALLDRLAGPAPVPGSARPPQAHATGAPPPSSNGAAVTALGRDEARPAAPRGSGSAARDAEDPSPRGPPPPPPPPPPPAR